MAEVELEEEDCAHDRQGCRDISHLDQDQEYEGDHEAEGADQGPSIAGVSCAFNQGRRRRQVVGRGSIIMMLGVRGRGLVRMSAGGDEVGKSH